MIYIDRTEEPIPNVLLTAGVAELQILCNHYDEDNRYFENKNSSDIFKSNIYAHNDVKDVLIRTQNHKCCFCESRVTHISDGDVEHFRPKAAWSEVAVDGTLSLIKPGYYFLAYDWDNLMLSCLMCNQRIKKNNFPLLNEGFRRVVNHNYEVTRELPVFINPTLEDPEIHITFYEDSPRGISLRGQRTIEYLNLDRYSLNEARKEKLKDLFTYKDILNVIENVDERDKIIEIIKKRINEIIDKKGQYINMVKANFSEFL
ncbi:hypothetical protein [Sphingobacterium anhuiense]|uniref:hypothetical protein n=1 Tax=Sphingobacterium anhuiense TaxID=493780 RepID=UPI003C2EFCC0